MKKELLDFLNEERSISEYKILTLDRGELKPYKARLLSIERDFLKFSFDSLKIEEISELRSAVLMFKTDRPLFDKKYNNNLQSKSASSPTYVTSLRKRITFFKNLHKYLLENKIRKVNLLEEKSLQKVEVESLTGIDSVREAEGALLSKERARIQILIYCFARVIYKEILNIESDLNLAEEGAHKDLSSLKTRLDGLFDFGISNIFKHYNSGIIEVPLLINGTMGHNDYVSCIYPLANLTDSMKKSVAIKRVLPKNKDFFSKTGVPISKKFVKRGFSLILPIARVGNETMELLFSDIFSLSGVCLNSIMTKEFYNIGINDVYYKALSTIPVWDFERKMDGPHLNREALRLLGLEKTPLVGTLDVSDESTYVAINKNHNGRIDLDINASKLLVAVTRSESSHINQAYFWIKLLIKEIKDGYEGNFSPKEITESSESRKTKYLEFLRNK